MNRRMMMQIVRDENVSDKTIPINYIFNNSNTSFSYYFSWSEVQEFLGKTVLVTINLTCKAIYKSGGKPSTTDFKPLGYRPDWSTVVGNELSDTADTDGYYTQNISVEKQFTFPAEVVSDGPFTCRDNYSKGSIIGTMRIREV